MTDRKKIMSKNGQAEEEFFSTAQLLNEGLQTLDRMEIVQQDEQWFEQFALDEMEKVRTRLKKELFWFLLCALMILSGVMFTFLKVPQLFFFLQASAIAIALIYSYKYAAKQVDGR